MTDPPPLDPAEQREVGTNDGAVPPQIFRGEPPRAKRAVAKKRLNPWRRNLELGREFPGQWVLMSQINKVGIGCKERTRLINLDKRRLQNWLRTYHPLERWKLSVHTLDGTNCTKQLVGMYLRTLTPEEHEADRARTRKNYEAMMVRRQEKARERTLTARLQRHTRGGAQR